MKIIIDINHPAHVHYFRNFIRIMESKGHTFIIINRDSLIINQLLDFYNIPHFIRNKRPLKKNTLKTISYLFGMIVWCIKMSFKYKPDMYLGFGSSACAITSFIFNKPCILLDDTEHNSLNHKLYTPFCSAILTPYYFRKNLGNKQIYFHAFVEQLYMHSVYFKSNNAVLKEIGALPKEYILVRYIAYDAHHDSLVKPLSDYIKKQIIIDLSKKYRVLLSMERNNTDEFYQPYLLNISPEKMHDVIANAKFVVSEGATMASEAFVVGVPYVYANPLMVGYIEEQIKTHPKMASFCINEDRIENVIYNIINNTINNKQVRKEIENSTINPTNFLTWFIENYPKSKEIIKQNPDYQYQFK